MKSTTTKTPLHWKIKVLTGGNAKNKKWLKKCKSTTMAFLTATHVRV